MAEELNKNGFTDCNGNRYKVTTNIRGEFVAGFAMSFVLSKIDKKAVDFLIELGLLNNGRCPLTGLMISPSIKTTFTSKRDSDIKYDISTMWLKHKKRNWGCLVSLVSLLIIFLGIIMGIVNGFDVIVYIIMIGCMLFLLSGVYVFAKAGYNANEQNLADHLGINPITLNSILKIKEVGESLSSKMGRAEDIPDADWEAYVQWISKKGE